MSKSLKDLMKLTPNEVKDEIESIDGGKEYLQEVSHALLIYMMADMGELNSKENSIVMKMHPSKQFDRFTEYLNRLKESPPLEKSRVKYPEFEMINQACQKADLMCQFILEGATYLACYTELDPELRNLDIDIIPVHVWGSMRTDQIYEFLLPQIEKIFGSGEVTVTLNDEDDGPIEFIFRTEKYLPISINMDYDYETGKDIYSDDDYCYSDPSSVKEDAQRLLTHFKKLIEYNRRGIELGIVTADDIYEHDDFARDYEDYFYIYGRPSLSMQELYKKRIEFFEKILNRIYPKLMDNSRPKQSSELRSTIYDSHPNFEDFDDNLYELVDTLKNLDPRVKYAFSGETAKYFYARKIGVELEYSPIVTLYRKTSDKFNEEELKDVILDKFKILYPESEMHDTTLGFGIDTKVRHYPIDFVFDYDRGNVNNHIVEINGIMIERLSTVIAKSKLNLEYLLNKWNEDTEDLENRDAEELDHFELVFYEGLMDLKNKIDDEVRFLDLFIDDFDELIKHYKFDVYVSFLNHFKLIHQLLSGSHINYGFVGSTASFLREWCNHGIDIHAVPKWNSNVYEIAVSTTDENLDDDEAIEAVIQAFEEFVDVEYTVSMVGNKTKLTVKIIDGPNMEDKKHMIDAQIICYINDADYPRAEEKDRLNGVYILN